MLESTFSWRAHPAVDRPGAATIALIVIFMFAVLIGDWIRDEHGVVAGLLTALGGVAVLILSLHRFFLPTRYVVDDRFITSRGVFGRRSLELSRVRRFLHDARGGYLSTRARPSRLFDAFYGMHIAFDSDQRDAVAAIESALAASRGTAAEQSTSAEQPIERPTPSGS